MGGVREIQHVPTLTLDSLLEYFPTPDFIKIDIEGAEDKALKESKKLINKIRPVFYIEIGRDKFDQIMKLFMSGNYQAFDINGNNLMNKYAFNSIFIPEEKTNHNN